MQAHRAAAKDMHLFRSFMMVRCHTLSVAFGILCEHNDHDDWDSNPREIERNMFIYAASDMGFAGDGGRIFDLMCPHGGPLDFKTFKHTMEELVAINMTISTTTIYYNYYYYY